MDTIKTGRRAPGIVRKLTLLRGGKCLSILVEKIPYCSKSFFFFFFLYFFLICGFLYEGKKINVSQRYIYILVRTFFRRFVSYCQKKKTLKRMKNDVRYKNLFTVRGSSHTWFENPLSSGTCSLSDDYVYEKL